MRSLVVTTINPPSQAVREYADLNDWDVLIVGDKKTPVGWEYPDVTYFGPNDARSRRHRIHSSLPWNHYGRKMLGYLEAMARGATTIAESDDDNVPYRGWGFPDFGGTYATTAADLGYVNIYSLFSDQAIWPRGLPLRKVLDPASKIDRGVLIDREVRVGVWQGLADGDPDVDAIYRLVSGRECTFQSRLPVTLASGTFSPFNSQNTAFHEDVFPLLFLPAFVNFRYTDILRGVVAQPILHAAGLQLGVCCATVFQERNDHDFMKDFESEVPMYLTVERAQAEVCQAVASGRAVEDNLHAAYAALRHINVVADDEVRLLDAWLEDVERLRPLG